MTAFIILTMSKKGIPPLCAQVCAAFQRALIAGCGLIDSALFGGHGGARAILSAAVLAR